MQQTKLLEDILNSQASLNADESLMAFAMMLASVDEYRFYNSSKDDFTKSLAERYINNDAWAVFVILHRPNLADCPFRRPSCSGCQRCH